jgi:hypothetical protein
MRIPMFTPVHTHGLDALVDDEEEEKDEEV